MRRKQKNKQVKSNIIAAICITMGLAIMSVPFFFFRYGEQQTHSLLAEIEKTVTGDRNDGTKAETEKGKIGTGKERTALSENELQKEELQGLELQGVKVLGIIEIDALELKYPIIEGCGNKELSVGIGHITDTAGIGEMGNSVLAGHRGSRYGTFFKYLNRLQEGDIVKLTDMDGNRFYYEVVGMEVVEPYEQSVKNQGQEKELTLLTCENNGTMRLIVRCRWKEDTEWNRLEKFHAA